jgi:hypothetical protein
LGFGYPHGFPQAEAIPSVNVYRQAYQRIGYQRIGRTAYLLARVGAKPIVYTNANAITKGV